MYRLVAHYRYLLLACVVLAAGAAVECLLIHPLPRSGSVASAPQVRRSSLREKYERIATCQTGKQMQEILGPPTFTEQALSDSVLWCWQEDGDTIIALLADTDDPWVICKGFGPERDEPRPDSGRQPR